MLRPLSAHQGRLWAALSPTQRSLFKITTKHNGYFLLPANQTSIRTFSTEIPTKFSRDTKPVTNNASKSVPPTSNTPITTTNTNINTNKNTNTTTNVESKNNNEVPKHESTIEGTIFLLNQMAELIAAGLYDPPIHELMALLSEGFTTLGAARTIIYYNKSKKAGLHIPKSRVEEFIPTLKEGREVGVLRALLALLNKTDYSDVMLFLAFWRWVVSNPNTQQFKALEQIFSEKVVNTPIQIQDPDHVKMMNTVDPRTRTVISFDMFIITFFQDLFNNPMRGRDIEDDGDEEYEEDEEDDGEEEFVLEDEVEEDKKDNKTNMTNNSNDNAKNTKDVKRK